MKPPAILRSVLPLIIGLAIGGIGVLLFQDSMPAAAGSPEERANRLELELKRAQNRIAALEAGKDSPEQGGALQNLMNRSGGAGERGRSREFSDGARSIAEDLRAGRPVSPDDIFRSSKPLLRDLAPLFERMHERQQQQVIDSMSGELARKYNLSPQNQAVLKQWFEQRAAEEAKRWNTFVASEDTRLEDVFLAARDVRPDEGIEAVMASLLPSEQFAAFREERLAERAQRVQQEADAKVQRLNGIVDLDETQRDQIFGIMARTSRDYDPAMVLEGAQGEIPMTPGGNRQAAVLSVLRPDQRAAYDAERQKRFTEAAKDAAAIGLALPADWELFDQEL